MLLSSAIGLHMLEIWPMYWDIYPMWSIWCTHWCWYIYWCGLYNMHTCVDHWIFILNYCDTESQKAQTGQDMDCSRLEQQ